MKEALNNRNLPLVAGEPGRVTFPALGKSDRFICIQGEAAEQEV